MPGDITVKSINRVHPTAHARFDATSRSYEYHVATRKDPFNAPFHYYLKNKPDIDLMNEAAKFLLSYEDFQCFSKTNTDVKTYHCDILHAEWKLINNELI